MTVAAWSLLCVVEAAGITISFVLKVSAPLKSIADQVIAGR